MGQRGAHAAKDQRERQHDHSEIVIFKKLEHARLGHRRLHRCDRIRLFRRHNRAIWTHAHIFGLGDHETKNKRHHDQKGKGAVGQEALPPTKVLNQLRTDIGHDHPRQRYSGCGNAKGRTTSLIEPIRDQLAGGQITHTASAKANE